MNTSTYIHFAPTLEENAFITKSEKILNDFLDREVYISEKNKGQLYSDVLNGFGRKGRDDGSVYIEHLIGVYEIALQACQELCIDFDETLALICLLHDSIEDTPETFETLYEKYGFEIAIAVKMLSKISLEDFFNEVKEGSIVCSDKELPKKITNLSFENLAKNKKLKHHLKRERNQYYYFKFGSLEAFQQRLEGIKREYIHQDAIDREKWFQDFSNMYEKICFVKVCDSKHNNLNPKPDRRATEIKNTETHTFLGILRSVSQRCAYILDSMNTGGIQAA